MKDCLVKRRLLSLITAVTIASSTLIGGMLPSFAAGSDQEMGTTPSGIEFSNMEASIDEYVSDYIGQTVPGAAVAVVKDGEIIFTKGYGYMDEKTQKAVVCEETIFEWGSMTKLFTWTAAMQLVEEGLIDLDEDILTYLPDSFVDHWDYDQTITMRNLMNHTAGFGDYGFDLIYDSPDLLGSLEADILKAHPDQYIEVGSASAYSNYGTSIAGLVIENVSGMSYEDYLKKHFYDVLNMKSTTSDRKFDVPQDMRVRKAKAYKATGETGYEETIWSYVAQGPAGSLNGTVVDLAQFVIALMPEQDASTPLFENAQTLDALLRPSYMMTAHGFFEFDGEYQSFGHGGNTAGFTGQLAIVPEERFGLVILTNVSGELNVCYGIQEMLIGKKNYPQKDDSLNLPDAKLVEGQYISYRRPKGSFLEPMSYLAPFTIEKTDENEIKASIGGLEATYVQTQPYTYKITGRDVPLFNMAYSVLRFDMESGEVRQLTAGHGMDMQPLESAKATWARIGSLVIVGLSAVLALIGLVVAVVLAVKNRKSHVERAQADKAQKNMARIQFMTTSLIVFALINNVMCLGSFIANSLRSLQSMMPYVAVNYILVALTAGLIGYSVRTWSNEGAGKSYRFFLSASFASLLGLFVVLIHWNFFLI